MAAEQTDPFAALVGRPVGRGPSVAPDPVNLPMIRHWAAAFEDRNPAYPDGDAARRTRHGGIVAPPLMLQTWTMATPKITGIRERGSSPTELEGTGPLAALDQAGLVATLATDSEFEILRYLRIGDVVRAATVIEAISEEKRTRLGPGRFVTWATTYTDQDGAVVGRQRFRILKFDPGRAQVERQPDSAPAVASAPRGTPDSGSGAAGDREQLPLMEIAVTATVIVAGAIATRDFMPVHHDRDYAQSQGAPDIFMNILSDTAYCSRFLTDWAGPEAMIRRLAIRLGVPVFPGHTLGYEGTVVARRRDGNEQVADVGFTATNDLGPHVTGTAELSLLVG